MTKARVAGKVLLWAVTLFLALVCLRSGVKSLDAGIIGYIEPVLNPIWVFLVLGERPSRWALLGGAIIITAVVAHTLWEARRRRAERAAT